jgi:hypothetical protein
VRVLFANCHAAREQVIAEHACQIYREEWGLSVVVVETLNHSTIIIPIETESLITTKTD